jgi:hypothetical protein
VVSSEDKSYTADHDKCPAADTASAVSIAVESGSLLTPVQEQWCNNYNALTVRLHL